MVSPVAPRPLPTHNQPVSGSGKSGSLPTLSKEDLLALRGAGDKKSHHQSDGESASGKHSSRAPSKARTRRSETVGKTGSRKPSSRSGTLDYVSLRRGGNPDSTITKPPTEFSVLPAMKEGSDVLLSVDGKKLHNLQGPIAEKIYDDLVSNNALSRSERPTVWLGTKYANIPVAALQDHLDTISPAQDKMIAVDADGMLHVLNADQDVETQSYAYVVTPSSADGDLATRHQE